jgi:hypothetical protein
MVLVLIKLLEKLDLDELLEILWAFMCNGYCYYEDVAVPDKLTQLANKAGVGISYVQYLILITSVSEAGQFLEHLIGQESSEGVEHNQQNHGLNVGTAERVIGSRSKKTDNDYSRGR